ncbi:transcription factor DIVARICATA-like [Tripterygium wilfordii]|uniref:Transcription factor DIVARICATA-like n=1 Tax=Tripterygium wilfordii TaxID=458696 RepID=A0A7J7CQD8_TRIWF|nr:transcription factor DIVARICATA-like [Tripterygium wilfordii]KAF5736333.1 transcription factor DIVARICATA-like [Tripterygium wilfordii]
MDPISSSPVPPLQTQTQYWTFEENKLFENALTEFDHVFPDLFEKIACRLPGKTIDQIKQHYENLVYDVEMIEAGFVPLPNYEESNARVNLSSAPGVGCQANNQNQRRKPNPWTPEEHKLFLEGLEKYGKGDWRSISRNCVISKTPTQVASHAQKHFLRLEKNLASSTTSRPGRNPTTSNTDQAAPPSANVSAPPSPPPFMPIDTSLLTTSLPSFSDLSTIEELDQLLASYTPSDDRQQ